MKSLKQHIDERTLAKKGNAEVVTKNGVARVMVKGKEVASGDFDDGAGGWFMSRPKEKGQKFFDNPNKILDFYKEEFGEETEVVIDESVFSEGKMKQFHMMMDAGKSAEEIAKKLKLDLKAVKDLMEEDVKETVEEVAEAKDIVDTIKTVMEDGYSQIASGDGTDLSLNDVRNPDVIDQLNAHIGMIGHREYLNPKGALIQLQQKLNTIGINFEIPSLPEEAGTVAVPLTQFGGIFGKSADTPIDQFDHENPAEGLSIQFEYEKHKTGCTKIYAKIV